MARERVTGVALSKTAYAKSIGVSRQSLYYRPKRPHRDQVLRDRILSVLDEHPAYGSRPLAIHFQLVLGITINRKRIQRIMRLYSIRPKLLRKHKFRWKKPESVIGEVPNRMKTVCPIQPDAIWAGDFTHLWFQGREVFLATAIDCFTREIVAWQVGIHHTTGLVLDVLNEAKRRRGKVPQMFHSDQGSEYTATHCLGWLTKERVLISWSPKGKPWNNGKQESFYNTFKFEFGSPSRYFSLEALVEGIGQYIHYYNTKRIHRRIKMPPQQFHLKTKRDTQN